MWCCVLLFADVCFHIYLLVSCLFVFVCVVVVLCCLLMRVVVLLRVVALCCLLLCVDCGCVCF